MYAVRTYFYLRVTVYWSNQQLKLFLRDSKLRQLYWKGESLSIKGAVFVFVLNDP